MTGNALMNLCLAVMTMAVFVPGLAKAETNLPEINGTVVTTTPAMVEQARKQKQKGTMGAASGLVSGNGAKLNTLTFKSTNTVKGNLTAQDKSKVNIGGVDMGDDGNSANNNGDTTSVGSGGGGFSAGGGGGGSFGDGGGGGFRGGDGTSNGNSAGGSNLVNAFGNLGGGLIENTIKHELDGADFGKLGVEFGIDMLPESNWKTGLDFGWDAGNFLLDIGSTAVDGVASAGKTMGKWCNFAASWLVQNVSCRIGAGIRAGLFGEDYHEDLQYMQEDIRNSYDELEKYAEYIGEGSLLIWTGVGAGGAAGKIISDVAVDELVAQKNWLYEGHPDEDSISGDIYKLLSK